MNATESKPWLQRMRRQGRLLALALLLGTVPLFTGCYGKFPVTRAVYELNGDASDNEVVQSLLMWVFVIIPVYGFAALGDALIFNLVEFWTGDTATFTLSSQDDGTAVALRPGASAGEAVLTMSDANGTIAEHRFTRLDNGMIEARDMDGTLVGLIQRDSRGLNLMDRNGHTIRTISSEALAANGAS